MTSVKTTFRWECLPCKKYYSSIQGYDYHLLTHTQSKPYKCKFCPLVYRSSSHTHEHMRQKHLQEYMGHKQRVRASGRKGQGQKSKPKSKSKCTRGRKQSSSQENQGQSQTGSRTSNRTRMIKTTTEPETVRRFQVQVDSVKTVPCLNCTKTFQDERSLKIHWTKMHEQDIFNKSSARNLFQLEPTNTNGQNNSSATNNKISSISASNSGNSNNELVLVDSTITKSSISSTTNCSSSSSSSSVLQRPLSLLLSNSENVPLPNMETNITHNVNDFLLSTTKSSSLKESESDIETDTVNSSPAPTSMSLEPNFDDCMVCSIICSRCNEEFFESRELRKHIVSLHQDIECIDAFETKHADDEDSSLLLNYQSSVNNRKSVIVYAPSWSNSLESISYESSYDSSTNHLELE